MTLLNKLKATCPHCQHRFFRFKTEKSIKFCPHCELSLLDTGLYTYKSNIDLKTKLFITLIVFVLTYMMPIWTESLFIKEFGYIFAYILGVIMLIAVITLLLSIVLLHNKMTRFFKTAKGVDELGTVRSDIGNYVVTLQGSTTGAATCCPNCHSQRLQVSYWFKTNLAKRLVSVTVPKANDTYNYDDNALGCLNCYTQYEKVETKRDYLRIGYVSVFIVLMLSINFKVHVTLIDKLQLTDSEALLLTSLLVALLAYVTLSINNLGYTGNEKGTLKVIGNANTEDNI